MTYIITAGIFFVLGMLHGQGKLIPWVRGAAGKARGVVFGLRPAREPVMAGYNARAENTADLTGDAANSVIEGYKPEVSPTPPKNPIPAGQAAKNILAFFGGLLTWMAKNPMLAIGLVVLAAFLLLGPPSCSPFGKSRGELRLEREIAQRQAQFQETLRERDEAITAIRTETARTLEQIRLESQRGHDAIAAATPEHEDPIDPNLVAAWRDALDGLCVPRADGTRADTCRS